MKRAPVLPPPTRRGLSRAEAADYVSISPSLFDRLVEDGRMPPPRKIDHRLVWDRLELDAAFDRLPRREDHALIPPPADDQPGDDWSDFQ